MTPRTAREVAPDTRTRMEGQAAQERREHVRPDREIRSEADERAVRRIRANHVLVRCRQHLVGGRRVWDVYRIEGDRLVLLVAGCAWQEEALALASDALLGRVSVSLAGLRTTFGGPRGDGLVAPKGGDLVRLGDRPIAVKEVCSTQGPLLPGDLVVTGKDSRAAQRALRAAQRARGVEG